MPQPIESVLPLAEEVAQHMNADTAPTAQEKITVDASTLAVRTRGAFITRLELVDPTATQTNAAVPVLYSQDELSIPKLVASHAMSPVGPSESPGGQHGFPRWVDYQEIQSGADNELALVARTPLVGPRFMRRFLLNPQLVVVESTLLNTGEDPMHTSLGEHYYFATQQRGGVRDILVQDQPLDELLKRPGTAEEISQGIPQFWDGYDGGTTKIAFPDGKTVNLTAEFSTGKDEQPEKLGMLIWSRKDKDGDYVCFEPTAGFSVTEGEPINTSVSILRGEAVRLTTAIELV